jgi:thiol reductant ABC exporter, CydD subunit
MKPLDPRLLRQARSTGRYLAAVALLGVVGAALVIAQAVLLADAITRVFLGGAGVSELVTPLVVLAAIVLARAGLAWVGEVAAYRAAAGVKSELRGRLLGHLMKLGPGWLHGERTGEVVTLATRGLDALDSYFSRYLPQLVLAALVPAAVLAVVFPADLIAGATILVTLPLIPIFMALIGLATERLTRRQLGALTRLTHHVLEIVAGLPTLRVFNRAKAQAAAIRDLTAQQRHHGMRALRVAFLSSLALELLATLSVALVAVGIGLRVVDGTLDLRTALTVLILAPEAYLPLRQVGVHFHASAEGLAAARRVFEILETPVPPSGGRTDVPDPRRVPIAFEAVTVHFADRAEPALDGLDLTVRPGEILAITGPSGCGKSTVANLLLGFVTPTAGRVRVGEVDLAGLDPDAWRRRVAYVPQRSFLFAGTVAENIALGAADAPSESMLGAADAPSESMLGASEATAEAIERAAAEAGLSGLPGGLSAPVGILSAGQRQRVALARAFLRDAPLVVLDEPTANLDADTEADIIAAIRRLARGRTVVLMAHRPALWAVADRVVRLRPASEGRPASDGSAVGDGRTVRDGRTVWDGRTVGEELVA